MPWMRELGRPMPKKRIPVVTASPLDALRMEVGGDDQDKNDDDANHPRHPVYGRQPPPRARTLPVLPSYAELHCRSNFTFLTGASHPEELVMRAAQLGYSALAITDECSVAGVVRAHVEAKAKKLHLIVGAEMRLTLPQGGRGSGAAHARLVLLAQTRRGYGNLSHWITLARRRAEKGSYLAWAADLEGKAASAPTLAGLPGCLALWVPHAGQPFEEAFAQAMWVKTWFQERAAIALELLHRAGDE